MHGNHDPLDGVSWAPSLTFPPQAHRFGTAAGESAVATRDGVAACRHPRPLLPVRGGG